jgi:trk system potassium uptake protein TrkA
LAGKQRAFAVVGLGTFGRTIATELARFGDYVLGIDVEERQVSAVADSLSEAVIADGRDEQALREAGVGRYDVGVVAIGEDLEANILCTMNIKRLGVGTLWAKAISATHHQILTKLGADRVIHPEQEIGQHVAQMLHNPLVGDYLRLGDERYVVQIEAPEQFDGQRIGELRLLDRFRVRCIAVLRGDRYRSADDGTAEIAAGDKLLLLGGARDLRVFGDTL